MQVRLNRLQSDYEAMRGLVRECPLVRVKSVQGDPPEKYQIHLAVKSLTQSGANIQECAEHLVEIRLPLGYPRDAPVCRMLTPVFHPNIAPHAICIGDHWTAGEALNALVLRICEMLAYQSYNIQSPLNGDAAWWVQEHLDELPLDPNSFILAEADFNLEQPTIAEDNISYGCTNCGDKTSVPVMCQIGHALCENCLERCPTCNNILCLACGQTSCEACH
ncbi:MAG: ubiquitin-conjugating enzyme E2 [Geminicoccaceae bacterium]